MMSKYLALSLILFLLSACTSIPLEERSARRADIVEEAAETIALLSQSEPEFQQALEVSAGYFTARVSAANVAVAGAGWGTGVLFDKENGTRTFINLKRLDLGPGLGAKSLRVVILLDDTQAVDEIRGGKYMGALVAEATAGEAGDTTGRISIEHQVFVLSDNGAQLSATARLVQLAVNEELTDTGLSELSLPNIGMEIEDGREPTEQRQWNRKLPFLAQDVIDLGYDLPLPYGIKPLYTYVEQDQNLDGLQVGFSGGEKEPYEWVDFQNASSRSNSYQLIGDVWLFPFMNLFAYVGDIDGDAPMDVILEGNGMLDQIGVDCSKPGNLVLCNLLQDREITLPIEADFSGINYGVGFNLAGGWKGFFFTLPVSFSWIDMDTTTAEGGAVISASPRVGRLFELGSRGNLAVYAGAAYLDSDLRVYGSLALPGTDITIDYTVDQSNSDPWAGLVGANWDINSRWSLQLEYNGFVGSRESVIASLGWRF
mgnify:CR=1 FL=1